MGNPASRLALLGACALTLLGRDAAAQRSFEISTHAASVEHRVNAGEGVEEAAGLAYGGGVQLTTEDWIELSLRGRGGRLPARTANAEARSFGELAVGGALLPLPWLAFQLGATMRGYSTPLARQRWTSLSAGMEARVHLFDQSVRGTARLGLLPAVRVSGLESPDMALSTGAGLEYRRGRLIAGLSFDLERYDFQPVASVRRQEQLATLSFHVGTVFRR